MTDKSSGTGSSNSIAVPAAWSEIEVMRSIVSYCIPRFLGLNTIWNESGAPFDPAALSAPAPHPSLPISTFDEEPTENDSATADVSSGSSPKMWSRK